MRAIGLMSGTSLDGVDGVLTELDAQTDGRIRAHLLRTVHLPYPPELTSALLTLQARFTVRLDAIAEIEVALAGVYADAVAELRRADPAADIRFVACHGQTVWHRPPRGDLPGRSLQWGNAAELAERSGLAVVSDFRAADLAAGGHGAPLVPLADHHLFGHAKENRCVQNIGGIANVTFLPAAGTPQGIQAFDTGPGTMLIDAAARRTGPPGTSYDRDGRGARQGHVDHALLDTLLRHPFLQQAPPRSTGRDAFGDALLDQVLADWRGTARDLLATLTEFTAASIADAYRRFLPAPDRVLVGGGGARNPTLLAALARRMHPIPVVPTDACGVPAESREALAFAILGLCSLLRRPGNVPQATGARRAVVLGRWTPPA